VNHGVALRYPRALTPREDEHMTTAQRAPAADGPGEKPNRLVDGFIKIFGDLKIFPAPLFIVYDPGSYRVKGAHMREVMKVIEPGDILVRGYVSYLDSYFIPGYFSHVGLYLGKVEASDRAKCTEFDAAKARGAGKGQDPESMFATGDQMVVHAIAEGVLLEDLLNFCRCDYMAVLRLPRLLAAHGRPRDAVRRLGDEEARIHACLSSGAEVPFADCFPVLRDVALSKVGFPYDTTFDFTNFKRFSCTELVYHATAAIAPALQVAPRTKRVLFLERRIIEPDDYARSGDLETVWVSPSVKRATWTRLRPPAPPAPPQPSQEERPRVTAVS
jgi:hypothetical protein